MIQVHVNIVRIAYKAYKRIIIIIIHLRKDKMFFFYDYTVWVRVLNVCICLCAGAWQWFLVCVCQQCCGCPQWGVYTKWVGKALAPALHQRQYWLEAWECLCSQSSLDSWQWARARGDTAESNQQPSAAKCFVAGGMCLNPDLRATHCSALERSCPNGSNLPWSSSN